MAMATRKQDQEAEYTSIEGENTEMEATALARGRPSNIETTDFQEGRGDPTSTMLWSPRKRTGHKKSLEVRRRLERYLRPKAERSD